jgi:ubiquinone biosynthesis protein
VCSSDLLFKTAGRFNMEVQPSLVLLQKTLLNVEGLGRQLYPELDLWTTALPFLEDWNRRRMQPGTLFKALKENVPDWIEQLPLLPQLMIDNLSQARELKELNLSLRERLHQESERREKAASGRTNAGLALLAGSAISLLPALQPTLSTLPGATILLACGGVYLLCFKR